MNNLTKPRGTIDYDDKKLKLLKLIEKTLLNLANKNNYSQVQTPCFEAKELFVDAIGKENEIVYKQMFFVNNSKQKEQKYVLKPENTASIVRYIVEKKFLFNCEELKIAYFDKFFRYERPQNNRLREFYQFGVEIFQNKHYLVDIEAILFAFKCLKALKIKEDLILVINYLGTNNSRQAYLKDLKKSLLTIKSKLCLFCQKRLNTNLLRVLDCKLESNNFDNIPLINNYWTLKEKQYFLKVIEILKTLKINLKIEYKLVRGIDYYNGVVFEICLANNLKSALVGGGRYDNLVQKISQSIQKDAIGFAIGINRILSLTNLKIKKQNSINIVFIALDLQSYLFCLKTKEDLINNDLKACLYFCENLKLKKYFKIANNLKARFICVVSKNDLAQKKVTIKNYQSKKIINLDNILNFLLENND